MGDVRVPRSVSRSGRLIALLALASLATACVAAPASPASSSEPSDTDAAPTKPGGSVLASLTAPSSPTNGIIAWVDRPVAPFVEPTAQPLPTDARPCGSSDLSVRVGQWGAGMGNINLPVTFTNHSDSTCVLVGEPSLGGLRSDGALVPLEVTVGSYFGDPGPPANIASGQVAALNISGADGCSAAQSGKPQSYPKFRIGLPGGGSVDIVTGGFDITCGVSLSAFGVPADAVPAVIAPQSPLTAHIAAPATAVAGRPLVFTVTLTNPTDADFRLNPCPAYTEFVGTGSTKWVATVLNYELNCDATTTIPAGGSVTFEMHLALPVDQPAGSGKFGWGLQGDSGPWANAQLEILPAGG